MFGRQRAAAIVAEFLGTSVLVLLVLSVQRSTIGVPFFVAIAAGLAVAVMSFGVGASSGGFFNPAITIGMWTARRVSSLNAVLFVAAEFLGAWAAYGLFKFYSNAPLQFVGGHFTGRILVAEAVGAGLFAFGVAAAAYGKQYTQATRASFTGLALTVGIIAASTASIGILNPAVALGINAWVLGTYVLGPVLGAIIGVNLYALLFAPKESLVVETAAPKVVKAATVKKPAAKKKATKKTTRAKK